jgi:serine/threonine protein kinase
MKASSTGFLEKELIHNLLQECAKMYKFNHPHILTLTGVCLDGGPAPYIIMPFMGNGSLLSYLRRERDTFVLQADSESKVCVCGL